MKEIMEIVQMIVKALVNRGGGARDTPPLSFLGKIGQNNKLAPPSLGMALPSGKSWIRHCQISLSIKFMHNVTMCGIVSTKFIVDYYLRMDSPLFTFTLSEIFSSCGSLQD